MSIQQNTNDLKSALSVAKENLAKVNALPDAGSGGGGTDENCTITLTDNSFRGMSIHVSYVKMSDGQPSPQYVEFDEGFYEDISVRKGTVITVAASLNQTTGELSLSVVDGEATRAISIENNVASVFVNKTCEILFGDR